MNKIIIFGNKDLAQLAKFYIDTDPGYTDYEVVAFTVDREYMSEDSFQGLPIVPFDEIKEAYSPDEYLLFAPMTGAKASKVREDVFSRGKEMGYSFFSFLSSFATILTKDIGDNCFILEDNTIQPFVSVGDNVVMWSGNHIGHHSVIEDSVFFTSHVVLSGHCVVKKYSWLGVNSTIRDGITLATGTLVAMAACITKPTEEWGIYMGAPASRKGEKRSDEVL